MKKTNITEEELQSAIAKFLRKGGIINKLPDEKTSNSRMVGHRYQATEMGSERSAS